MFVYMYLNSTIVASGAVLQESEGLWAHIQHTNIRNMDKALSGRAHVHVVHASVSSSLSLSLSRLYSVTIVIFPPGSSRADSP